MKRALVAILLTLSLAVTPLISAYASTTSENEKASEAAENINAGKAKLSEAEAEMDKLKQQLADAKNLIAGLSASRADIESKVKELDQQLSAVSAQIEELDGELLAKNDEIEKAEAELDRTEELLENAEQIAENQYRDMKLRIQFLYENTTTADFLNLFHQSGSITEFLNAASYVNDLVSYDRTKLTAYEETVDEIANLEQTIEEEKAALEEDRAELEALKEVAEEQKSTVAALSAAKQNELLQVDTYIDVAENTAEAYEDEIAAQNEVIAEIRAEIAREEAKKKAAEAAGETYSERTYDGGIFLWPCPASHRVTSDYGYRTSPTAGASTYHKGIDIGAPYGSSIIAAADGEVTFAGYSSGAGNYVIVNHGSGLRSVYMHASSLNVSVGQIVSAGDTVAFVGSTGISTGNHLHFGVSLNGEYVSPWNYLGS